MSTVTTTAVSLEIGAPVPMSLGDCADALAEIRDLRIELEHRASAVEEREKEIEQHIIASLEKERMTGVVGSKYTAKVVPKVSPVIDDWQNFTAWVLRTQQTQVLYRRVNAKAVDEIRAAGQPLPDGVGMKSTPKLSLTKA